MITYGLPDDMISCPSCGKKYKGRVCTECEECEKCCRCKANKFIPAQDMIDQIAGVPEEAKR